MSELLERQSVFRRSMVDDLRNKLFGPVDSTDQTALRVDPLMQFATGVLFPQSLSFSESESMVEKSADEIVYSEDLLDEPMSGLEVSGGDFASEASEATEPLNLANEFSPSAAGITFRVLSNSAVRFQLSGATYSSVREFQESGAARTVWKREPFKHTLSLELTKRGSYDPIPIPTSRGRLVLRVISRPGNSDTNVVSAMLVNESISPDKPKSEDCFFQISIVVRGVEGTPTFFPIDRSFGGSDDQETRHMDLLYRHRQAFALGHGTASDWNRDEQFSALGKTDMVCTAAMPEYELKPIRPREKTFRNNEPFETSMGYLFEGDGSVDPTASIVIKLNALIDDYDAWILQQAKEPIPDGLAAAAQENLEKCRD